MIKVIIPQYGRWGSPEPHRRLQVASSADDPYFKKVGAAVFIEDDFFKILALSAFFLFWFTNSFIRKRTLLFLVIAFSIAFLHFESSFDWPEFSIHSCPYPLSSL